MVPIVGDARYASTTSTIEATLAFDRNNELQFSPGIVTLTEGKIVIKVTNLKTLENCVPVASLNVISQMLTDLMKPDPGAQVNLNLNHPYEMEICIEDEIIEPRGKEKLNPSFLLRFIWKNSLSHEDKKAHMKHRLVNYHCLLPRII